MLEELFHYYLQHPGGIRELSRKRARADGWPRGICDYIAGMMDRYVVQAHERAFAAT
jgi:dGTPase